MNQQVVVQGTLTTWTLWGFRPTNGDYYFIAGGYSSLAAVERAAGRQLEEFENQQPTVISGGQDEYGIQDRVYVHSPEGLRYRFVA